MEKTEEEKKKAEIIAEKKREARYWNKQIQLSATGQWTWGDKLDLSGATDIPANKLKNVLRAKTLS
jgi:hypothetical protein